MIGSVNSAATLPSALPRLTQRECVSRLAPFWGTNINRLRTQRGLTQDALAVLAEIDRRYVQRIEAGTANPGIDVIWRLRQALDVSWDELLRGLS